MFCGFRTALQRYGGDSYGTSIASKSDAAWNILDREREMFETMIRKVIDNPNTYDIEARKPFATAEYTASASSHYGKMRARNIRISSSLLQIKDIDVVVTQDYKDNTKDTIGLRGYPFVET